MFRRAVLRLLPLLALVVAVFSSQSLACVCDGTSTVDEAFRSATAVFAGKFVRSEYRKGIKNQLYEIHAEMDGKKGEEYEVLVYVFEAKTWWKGALTREVVLISDHTRAKDGTETISDCGLGFEKGREYLVYAYGTGDDFGTGACSRTMSLRRAAKDIARLDRLARGKIRAR